MYRTKWLKLKRQFIGGKFKLRIIEKYSFRAHLSILDRFENTDGVKIHGKVKIARLVTDVLRLLSIRLARIQKTMHATFFVYCVWVALDFYLYEARKE